MSKLCVHVMTPLRDLVTVMMLSLRCHHLERQVDAPFDAHVSIELDKVIAEQEQFTQPQG